jgi:hypothetical protein
MWTNEESGAFPYDIVLDELTLTDSVGTSALNVINSTKSNLSFYPNPANNTSNVMYTLPTSGHLKLSVINTLGQEVDCLYNGYQNAGSYQSEINVADLPNGIYLGSLELNNELLLSKMIIVNNK